jgi:hypothetical protein
MGFLLSSSEEIEDTGMCCIYIQGRRILCYPENG